MLYGVEDVPQLAFGSYVASAVHFDGGIQGGGPTWLDIPSLTATDNGLYSFSIWIKGLTTTANNSGVAWIHDPANDYDPDFTISSSGSFDFVFSPFGGNQLQTRILPALLTSVAWHHVLFSVDLIHAAGAKVIALYVDRAHVSYSTTFNSGNFFQVADTGTVSELYNGRQFIFGDDAFSDGADFDVADVWIAPGVSLLSGSTIPDATIALFIDDNGNPADPTGWPTSAVQFYGNAANFPTNHGTGGAATLTGSLTSVPGPTGT